MICLRSSSWSPAKSHARLQHNRPYRCAVSICFWIGSTFRHTRVSKVFFFLIGSLKIFLAQPKMLPKKKNCKEIWLLHFGVGWLGLFGKNLCFYLYWIDPWQYCAENFVFSTCTKQTAPWTSYKLIELRPEKLKFPAPAHPQFPLDALFKGIPEECSQLSVIISPPFKCCFFDYYVTPIPPPFLWPILRPSGTLRGHVWGGATQKYLSWGPDGSHTTRGHIRGGGGVYFCALRVLGINFIQSLSPIF